MQETLLKERDAVSVVFISESITALKKQRVWFEMFLFFFLFCYFMLDNQNRKTSMNFVEYMRLPFELLLLRLSLSVKVLALGPDFLIAFC